MVGLWRLHLAPDVDFHKYMWNEQRSESYEGAEVKLEYSKVQWDDVKCLIYK